MKYLKNFFLIFSFLLSIDVYAQERLVDYSEKKGMFSLAGNVGVTQSGLLNANGNFSGYNVTNFGADVDFSLISGSDFKLFISYLTGSGSERNEASNKIKTEETIFGLKVGINSYMYMTAGMGPAKMTLSSTQNNTEIKLTNLLTRISLGTEIPVGSTFSIGLDLSYRSGPVKKSENTALSENSYYEGSGLLLKFIWSPPSVSNTYINK